MTGVLEGWYVRGDDAAILVLFASLLAFLGLVRRGRRSLRLLAFVCFVCTTAACDSYDVLNRARLRPWGVLR